MNLIWHNFKKDFKHLKWLLGLWLLAISLQAASNSLVYDERTPLLDQSLFIYAKLLMSFIPLFLILIIIPRLIQAEPLVGTTSFWLTRPISAWDLIKVKTVFIFTLLIFPWLLAQGLVLIFNDVTGAKLFLALGECCLKQFTFIIWVSAFAVLTSSMSKYFLTTGIGFIFAVFLAIGFFLISMPFYWLHLQWKLVDVNTLKQSREIAGFTFSILIASLVVVHQYFTRNTKRTLIMGLPLVIIAMMIVGYWSWDFMKSSDKAAINDKLDLNRVEVSVDKESVVIKDIRNYPQKTIEAKIEIKGLPATMVARPTYFEGIIEFPDGKKKSIADSIPFTYQWNREALEQALSSYSVVNLDDDPSLVRWFMLNKKTLQAYGSKPVKISGKFTFRVYRYQVTEEVSLRKGIIYQNNEVRDIVTDIENFPQGCRVFLQSRCLNLLFSNANKRNDFEGIDEPQFIHLLLNSEKRVAYCSSDRYWNFDFPNLLTHLKGNQLEIRNQKLYFSRKDKSQKNTPSITKESLLARVQKVPVGIYSKTFVLDNFILEPSKEKPSP